MINFLKKWSGQIGGVKVSQHAQPIDDDGEWLLVLTTLHVVQDVRCVSSRLPSADAEKLCDDAFRMEIARRDLGREVAHLREMAEAISAALSAKPVELTSAEPRIRIVRNAEGLDEIEVLP